MHLLEVLVFDFLDFLEDLIVHALTGALNEVAVDSLMQECFTVLDFPKCLLLEITEVLLGTLMGMRDTCKSRRDWLLCLSMAATLELSFLKESSISFRSFFLLFLTLRVISSFLTLEARSSSTLAILSSQSLMRLKSQPMPWLTTASLLMILLAQSVRPSPEFSGSGFSR